MKFSNPITDARFGLVTSLTLPGGAELGVYQPKHTLAPPWPAAKKSRTGAASRPKEKSRAKRRK